MSKLTAEERKKLKKEDFALPEKNGYPTHDRSHAVAALGRAKQFATPDEQKRVQENVCSKHPDLPSCRGRSKYENPFDEKNNSNDNAGNAGKRYR